MCTVIGGSPSGGTTTVSDDSSHVRQSDHDKQLVTALVTSPHASSLGSENPVIALSGCRFRSGVERCRRTVSRERVRGR